jgi:RNA polymerase sigma factor (TIGR02999 family)
MEQSPGETRNRAHFFAIAANLMRQILVNHARRRDAAKRGGGAQVTLIEDLMAVQPPAVDLIALDEALNWLAELDARQSRIVELRFFAGLTEEEIADVLGVSVVTVKRDWRIARSALYGRLSPKRKAGDRG